MRTLKKSLSIILVLVMLLSTFAINTSALADGATLGLVLRTDKTEAEIVPGAEVTVYFHFDLANYEQLMSDMRLCLVYDKSVYTADVTTRTFLNDLAGYAKDATAAKENDTFGQTCLTAAGASADEMALYDGGIMIQVGADVNLGANNKRGFLMTEGEDGVSVAQLSLTFTVNDDADLVNGSKNIIWPATIASANQYIKYTDGKNTPKQYATSQGDFSKNNILANMPEKDPCEEGHTPAEAVKENEVPASCSVAGSYESVVYCSVCNEEISRDTVIVDATGDHVYSKEIEKVEPTCTEAGYVVKACLCSDTVTERTELPATGHDYDSVVTAPTCTEQGYTTYTCSACGDNYVADYVEAAGHSLRSKVTAPTCTEGGYTERKCSKCDYTDVVDETEATGHDYDVVVTAPTCTEAGYTTYTCKVKKCGYTYVGDEVAATGHNHEVIDVKPATCAKDGFTRYACACGDTYDEPIPTLNHTHPDGTSALKDIAGTPATCDKEGQTDGKTCTICNTPVVPQKPIAKLPHTWDEGKVFAPDYDSEGYTLYTCTVCGETEKRDFTDKLEGVEVEIEKPASTEVKSGETVTLTAPVNKDGFTVKWEADNGNFTLTQNSDDSVTLTPVANGESTITVTVYDAEGNKVSSDSIIMTAVVEDAGEGDGEEDECWLMKIVNWIIEFFKKVVEIIVNLVNSLVSQK